MTATDGRTRTGDVPGPSDPSGPEPTPDGDGDGPAVARVRARGGPGALEPVPPGGARPVGRHSRPDGEHTGYTPPPGYRPRHAAPDAETEVMSFGDRPPPGPPTPAAPAEMAALADPTPVRGLPLASTFPASGVTASETVPTDDKKAIFGWDPATGDSELVPPARQRIVLAERRSPTRAVGTVAEIEQQTATGELLLSNLMRSQLMLAVRLTVVAVIVLGALPVVFLTMPAVSGTELFGVSLPWILLGVLAFPFLIVLGWLYTRTAERNELDFADDVED
ncbi:hypothetical protein [Actinomycetospora atypica]|uniref:DUF485 domain-containing protein n=1 Tax=Actinomycetospora atypica TaxID=1290095 RepID=A0ABV9YLD6_9PSEU